MEADRPAALLQLQHLSYSRIVLIEVFSNSPPPPPPPPPLPTKKMNLILKVLT